ncbi:hypothetical protein ACA30_05780 [Virgibacillus soli]|nr:hypothetical protein ACA30_05780 [Virgibacillus soli]
MIRYEVDQYGMIHNVRKGEARMNECKCCEALSRKIDKLEFEIRKDKIERMQDETEQRLDAVSEKLDELNG